MVFQHEDWRVLGMGQPLSTNRRCREVWGVKIVVSTHVEDSIRQDARFSQPKALSWLGVEPWLKFSHSVKSWAWFSEF